MKVVGNEMADHVEEIVALFNVFLPTVRAEFSQHFSATIKTGFFFAILLVTHSNGIGNRISMRLSFKITKYAND